MKAPSTCIIIVNYNGLSDTLECLRSISRICYTNFSVVVIDNRSEGPELDIIMKRFPWIIPIQNSSNLGYAGAINVGLKLAMALDPEFVIILNNDTIVDRLFVNKLVEVASSDNSVGVVGCKILYYSSPDRIWSTGGRFIADIGFISDSDQNKLSSTVTDIKQRDWVSGCGMLIRADVLRRIPYGGYHDTDSDDVEFCVNARRIGFVVLLAPSSIIFHKVSKTRSRQPRVWRTDPYIGLIVRYAKHKRLGLLSYFLIFRTLRIFRYVVNTPDRQLRGYYAHRFLHELRYVFADMNLRKLHKPMS
jgi:GT2 family glycosyltransferase